MNFSFYWDKDKILMKPQKIYIHLLLPIMLVGLLIFSTPGTAPAQTVPQIAEKALAATVYLEMQDTKGLPLGFGSGFFVGENLIATNYHVIEGAARGTAKLVGKDTKYTIEGFTATDTVNDLALLKVTMDGIKPLPLGKSSDIKIGETIYVAGNPKGLEGTFSDGLISSRRDRSAKERFQMTAPISPGSSGGPVLNRKGEVIGVSVSVHRDMDAQNLNFAIPSRYLRELLATSQPAKPLVQGFRSISAETYFTWGNIRCDLGDYKGAINDYTHGIQLRPDNATAYILRGTAKGALGKHFLAIDDYDKAIELEPDNATAYILRGTAKDTQRKHEEALYDYDKAIELEPDNATAYVLRGMAKYSVGIDQDAISDYDKAIELEPDNATAYRGRGHVKSSLSQHAAAISDYDKAIELEPDDASTYILRGIQKVKLNRTWGAENDFIKALGIAEKAGDASKIETIERWLNRLDKM